MFLRRGSLTGIRRLHHVHSPLSLSRHAERRAIVRFSAFWLGREIALDESLFDGVAIAFEQIVWTKGTSRVNVQQ